MLEREEDREELNELDAVDEASPKSVVRNGQILNEKKKKTSASKFRIFVLMPLPLPYSFDALRSFNRALGFIHVVPHKNLIMVPAFVPHKFH